MIKLYLVSLFVASIFLCCMINYVSCTSLNAGETQEIPPNSLAAKVTIVYQLTGSFLRVDTSATVYIDTTYKSPLKYKLGSGKMLPTNIFVAIYDFHDNNPPFNIDSVGSQPILSKMDWWIK